MPSGLPGSKSIAIENRSSPCPGQHIVGQSASARVGGIPRCDTETFIALLFDYTRALFVDEEEGLAR
jgi:hypothetical protein